MFIIRMARQYSGLNLLKLAQNFGLSPQEIREAEELVRSHEQEILDARNKHFPG
jgi:hypothetical protein